MYAARYAEKPDYEELLKKGLKRYPANPILLYLSGMCKHGLHDYTVGRNYLERAATLDPDYMDPWFSLVVHYMDQDDTERTNMALRHLLESGVITDEVMDYSYNMLAVLNENAILVTNGDNDTYPGFILTRLLNHRPDVTIVNRSLLDTDWYPLYLIKHGAPEFITQSQLEDLRETTSPPYGDTLIVRLIESTVREGRSVYFSWTLSMSDMVKRYHEQGRHLALVTLVTPSTEPYRKELKESLKIWLNEFRTGGLDSWRLHYADDADAGRSLMNNYAGGILMLMDSIKVHAPEMRLDLFNWYQKHLAQIVPQKNAESMNQMWQQHGDIDEIKEWRRSQGFIE